MVVQPVSTAPLAERLALAFDTAEVVVPLPAELPADMAAARQIKNSLAKSFGPAKAYKLGATIAAVQVTLGLEGPFSGALPASRIFAEGATVTGGGARQTGVESEYGFRLSRDITESNLPTNISGLVECIDMVHPAIEIPGTRFASLGVHGGFALMADGGAAGALVLGPAQPFDPAADFNAGAVTLEIDGKPVAAGRGDIIVNGPLFPLLAFFKEALATGYPLKAGQVVVTGSCTGYVEVPRGELVVARFAALGGATVSMRFGAGPG